MKFITYFIIAAECTKTLIFPCPSSNFHCESMICSSESADAISYFTSKNCQIIFEFDFVFQTKIHICFARSTFKSRPHYPKELTISETTESTSVASYLDLLFTRDRSNNITTKLYDKRDAFGFHIVNFPFMSSNIPSAPAYGAYASQLVRYARCCSSYSDFLIRHRALVKRLLSQGYKVNGLSNTFKKFYGRHTDLVGQYKKNVCQMFADSIS